MRHLTYREWQQATLAAIEAGEFKGEVVCPECRGRGELETTCHCCDGTTEEACDFCDGSGSVGAKELNYSAAHYLPDQLLPWTEYASVLERDLRALSEWQAKPAEELLTAAGFTVWTDLKARKLVCRITPDVIYRQEAIQ